MVSDIENKNLCSRLKKLQVMPGVYWSFMIDKKEWMGNTDPMKEQTGMSAD